MTAMPCPRSLRQDTADRAENGLPTYDARDLIQDGVQARVVLDDQTYVLRITRAGKLILTK